MARNRNTDFFSFLRSQGLRKRVAKALSDLEAGGQDARGNAEKVGRRVIADLRSAADMIEKRLGVGGSSRTSGARKAAKTRRRAAAKRSSAAKKGAKTRARKAAPRKTTARKSTARKSTARKTTGRKSTARKSTARKRS